MMFSKFSGILKKKIRSIFISIEILKNRVKVDIIKTKKKFDKTLAFGKIKT